MENKTLIELKNKFPELVARTNGKTVVVKEDNKIIKWSSFESNYELPKMFNPLNYRKYYLQVKEKAIEKTYNKLYQMQKSSLGEPIKLSQTY